MNKNVWIILPYFLFIIFILFWGVFLVCFFSLIILSHYYHYFVFITVLYSLL